MITCRGSVFCEAADCARYELINSGDTLKVYHDDSTFLDPWYNFVTDPPLDYLEDMISLWNDAYLCGDLFELVTDPALAHVVVTYEQNDAGDYSGRANTLSGPDGTVCNNVDQGTMWGIGNPATVTINQRTDLQNISEQAYNAVMLHELGHILGMGHVNDAGIVSIMALGPTFFEPTLTAWDIQMINDRYPCCETGVAPLVISAVGMPTEVACQFEFPL